MPDPVVAEVTPQAVVEATPIVTPVVISPEPIQTVITPEAPVTPAVVETPSVAVTEVPAEPAKSVLTTELDKLDPITPAEPVVASVVAPVEAVVSETPEGQSVEPAPPPKYEAFKVPEGVSLEDDKVKEFTDILSTLETGAKVDHTFSQEFGQKAVDFHVKEVQRILQNRDKEQVSNWEAQKTKWKDQFLADPEIGGARFQGTVDSALNFLRTHGGTQEQQKEFRTLMDSSGLGNHPAMIRLLAKAGAAMSEGKPLAANRPVAPLKSKTETMYGKR